MNRLTLLSGIALIASLTTFTSRIFAQITLDSIDLPHAGLVVVVDSDGTTKPSPGIAQISSAQSWDFSGLLRQKSKTETFYTVGATPYPTIFAAADLADSTFGGNGYNYFSTSSTNFAVEGAEEIESFSGYTFQIAINLNPTFQQSALPATTTTNNTAGGIARGSESFSVTVTISPFTFTQERFSTTIIYSDTVDAFGPMKMPNGNTYPVLRQKHYELDIDSALGYDASINTWLDLENIITNKNQYDWYAKGVGFILAEMDMSVTWDTIVDVEWDTTAPAPVPLAVNEISNPGKINVYPNPANGEISFIEFGNNSADQYLSIYDITGREIDRVVIKNGFYMLNTNLYNNGVYIYDLADISGNLIERGKFVIQH
jgi:Secretion system C-terminal sorting domain